MGNAGVVSKKVGVKSDDPSGVGARRKVKGEKFLPTNSGLGRLSERKARQI